MNEIVKLQKQVNNLTIKAEGIELEYKYVNDLKDKKIRDLDNIIKNRNEEKKYYKKEFDEAVRKMEQYKQELEKIKNSKWWKIREKIKRK